MILHTKQRHPKDIFHTKLRNVIYINIKQLCHQYRTFSIFQQKFLRLQYQMIYVDLEICICNKFYHEAT